MELQWNFGRASKKPRDCKCSGLACTNFVLLICRIL